MSTPIVSVPDVVLASEFPSLADRPAGTYNAKAKSWADSENAMSIRNREIALTAQVNAQAANERAVIADTRATDSNESAIAAALSAAQSESSNQSAAAIAAAIGDDAGLPSLAGNGKKALRVRADEQGVEWGPSGYELGDVLSTSRLLESPEWLPSDGSLYLQSSYPELHGVVGNLPFDPPAPLPSPLSGAGATTSVDEADGYLAIAKTTSPFVHMFVQAGDTYSALPAPAELPTSATDISLSAGGDYLAVIQGASPWLVVYKRTGTTLTKITVPAPSGSARLCRFSPDGTHLVIGREASPWIEVYKRTGDTFTKLAAPAAVPAGATAGIKFSADGRRMGIKANGHPLCVFSRSGDAFTRLPDLSPPASAGGYDFGLSRDGLMLFCEGRLYEEQEGTYAQVDAPALQGAPHDAVAFSRAGDFLALFGSPSSTNPGPLSVFSYDGALFARAADTGISFSGSGVLAGLFSSDGTRIIVSYSTISNVYKNFGYDPATLFHTPRVPFHAGGLRNYIKAKP
ncbi:hypothetical protein H0A70_08115 [Alcaligenaceae bacterium]|nr:hypothetical protein [Alcaligenaceae bacterium]